MYMTVTWRRIQPRWHAVPLCMLGVLIGSPCYASAQIRNQDAGLVNTLYGYGGAAVAFSPDGTRVLTAGEHAARVWDVTSLHPVTSPLEHPSHIPGDTAAFAIVDAVWLRDGRRIATSGANEVRIWDARSGKLLVQILQKDPLRAACISPDGTTVVTGNNQGAVLWDTATGRQLGTLREHGGASAAAFSRDGSRLLTCGDTGFHLWNLSTGREVTGRVPQKAVWGEPDISPDAKLLALGGHGCFDLYDVAQGKVIFTSHPSDEMRDVESATTLVRFTPSGSAIVWGSLGGVEAFSVATGRSLSGATIPVSMLGNYLDCAPDGGRIATGGRDEEAGIWDLATARRVQSFQRHGTCATCVRFSADGRRIGLGFVGSDPHNDTSYTEIWKVRDAAK